MRIQAAVINAVGGPFEVETLDLGPPRAGEVLVRMAAAGICHSDWHVVTGDTQHPLPVVAGHEGAGVVEAVGAGVTTVQPGDHVALNWAPNCGRCFYCLEGRPSLCQTYLEPSWAGTMLDGATRLTRNGEPVYHFSSVACFADYVVTPEPCCVPLAKDVPLPVAALIGCAVTTGVGAVFNTAQVAPGSNVAVFGAGGVGLNIIMGARLTGARHIIAVDRQPGKADAALAFGATHFLPAGAQTTNSIRDITDGRGADYVFEAVGLPAVQEQCLEAVRPGGTIVLVGLSPMGTSTNLPGAVLTRQEITVKGSYYGTSNTARDFPRYADLYLKGRLDLDRLVSKTYRLNQINEAYVAMLNGDLARGVILFGQN